MKHLPKHLQPRWRYLAVAIEGWPTTTLDSNDLQRALWYEAQNLYGDPGSAAVDPTVMRFDASPGYAQAMVRTPRNEVERARAVIACLASIDDQEIGVRVTGVSGTIRACEEKYMGARAERPMKSTVAFADADRSAFVRNERVDVETGDGFVGATTLDTD